MKTRTQNDFPNIPIPAAMLALAFSLPAMAFDSGSTGADGPLNPTVDSVIALPDDGVFNYTSINIPAGVTVRFERNRTNTPVRLLVAGDAQIDGIIDISGQDSPATGPAGDGVLADDGLPGIGGPGGFNGGRGGEPGESGFEGAQGLGPGGGFPALWQGTSNGNLGGCVGAGGGFGSAGIDGRRYSGGFFCGETASGGDAYGNDRLLPLIGGSGGGGGAGGGAFAGSGGGGGGGALLIAVSGTLTVNGEIRASGGDSGDFDGGAPGGGGGGGAGGGIRIVATTIAGDGPIEARGGIGWKNDPFDGRSGQGGTGRIRLESENITRVAATNPPFTFDEPGPIFLSGMPSLSIIRVAGIDAPAAPTGSADIVLPVDEPNPVEVLVAGSNVPLGNTVTVTMTPVRGNAVSELTDALDGTLESSTATTSIDIPEGPNMLQASVSFTVPESQARAFTALTDGEAVHEIRLAAGMQGESRTVLVTESGREVVWNGAPAR